MAYEQVKKPSSSFVPVQKKVSGFAPSASRVQAKDVTAGEQEQMPSLSTPATDANWLMKHPLFKGNQFLQRVVAPASESESLESEESLAQRETVQRQEEGKETGTPHSLPVQAKLTIGESGDKYEQEADRVAADVVQRIHAPAPASMRGGEGALQRQEMGDEEDVRLKSDGGSLQRVEISQLSPKSEREKPMEASADLEGAIQGARGSGQPLAESVREPMESEFGADFRGVRVHTDAKSDALNQSIQAKAFTTGSDIFFRSGAYELGSRGGQELLAHELTHVVQQSGEGVQNSHKALPGIKRLEEPAIQKKGGLKKLEEQAAKESKTDHLVGRLAEYLLTKESKNEKETRKVIIGKQTKEEMKEKLKKAGYSDESINRALMEEQANYGADLMSVKKLKEGEDQNAEVDAEVTQVKVVGSDTADDALNNLQYAVEQLTGARDEKPLLSAKKKVLLIIPSPSHPWVIADSKSISIEMEKRLKQTKYNKEDLARYVNEVEIRMTKRTLTYLITEGSIGVARESAESSVVQQLAAELSRKQPKRPGEGVVYAVKRKADVFSIDRNDKRNTTTMKSLNYKNQSAEVKEALAKVEENGVVKVELNSGKVKSVEIINKENEDELGIKIYGETESKEGKEEQSEE